MGIFLQNLASEEFDPKKSVQNDTIENHKCGFSAIKRFITMNTSRNGCTLFCFNRYAMKNAYLHHRIFPDDSIIIGNHFLQFTSAIFNVNSHFATGLYVQTDKESKFIFYDDMKPEGLVSMKKLNIFYNSF